MVIGRGPGQLAPTLPSARRRTPARPGCVTSQSAWPLSS